jgi:hypothetical protein
MSALRHLRPRKSLNPMSAVGGQDHTSYKLIPLWIKESIHTHINASLTALNVLKLQDRRDKKTVDPTVISIASWRRKKFNEDLMARHFARLELNRNSETVTQVYDEFSNYAAIAT